MRSSLRPLVLLAIVALLCPLGAAARGQAAEAPPQGVEDRARQVP